jgi:GlpG protein
MRHIGTISDEAPARTLADYLLTLQIETQLHQDAKGWEIWVRDEDRVPRAKEELAAFQANPNDPKFGAAARTADQIRRSEEQADRNYERRQVALAVKLRPSTSVLRPVTGALIAACFVVFFASSMGNDENGLTRFLFIIPVESEPGGIRYYPELSSLTDGQIWRLVTPIFLHFSMMHIAGNMMWLFYLGNMIESRRGALRFSLLVLVIAVLSNVGQFYLGHAMLSQGHLSFRLSPAFGGMSGVVFGLFGYVWMKMRFDPNLGMALNPQSFFLTLMWFAFCFTGLAGPIANAAHAIGLIVGIAIGAAPAAWRKLTGIDGSDR